MRDAYEQYLDDWDEHGAPWEYWVERAEAARGAFARARQRRRRTRSPSRRRVSAGVSALASGLRFDEGRDTVVVTDWEFPTIGQIWHAQERARRARRPRAGRGGRDDPARALRGGDRRADGARLDHARLLPERREGSTSKPIARLAHERGALVLLDAYQSVGSLPIDVRALGVDFLAAGVLKYLLGSAGLGFLYCRRELVESDRADRDGLVRRPRHLRDGHPRLLAGARRRAASSRARRRCPSIYAGIAGIELMQEIGIAETAEARARS